MARLPLHSLLDQLRLLLSGERQGASMGFPRSQVYLVGGAVRDALIGRTSHDLDFATGGDAVLLARRIADRLGGSFYLMDAQRGIGRVIVPQASSGLASRKPGITLDFSKFRGETLIADLCDRDLTINAMALPANSDDSDCIIDPLGGQGDLAAGIVRATGPHAMFQDPVRGLRAVRQAAEFQFTIDRATRQWIREASLYLKDVSAERIRDEFCRLMSGPDPATCLRELDDMGLLSAIVPEMDATKGVAQSAPHTTDVWEHTLLTLQALVGLLSHTADTSTTIVPDQRATLAMAHQCLEPFAADIEQYLARPSPGCATGRALLFMATALHDVGKPRTRTRDEGGQIRFLGHEQKGADLALERSRSLALSSDECRQIGAIVQHHMRPAWLASATAEAQPSRRSIYRFFRDTGANGIDICLLCLADALGKGTPPDPEEWQRRLRVVEILLDGYFRLAEEVISPRPLLGGRELMAELKIQPGPEVGRLLALIREAQAAGEVVTVDEAYALARAGERSSGRHELRS